MTQEFYNPFAQTIRDQWEPYVRRECELLNVRAITNYKQAQANWMDMAKSYESEPWFEERYPYPVPDRLWVAGLVDLEEGGKVYRVPGPVQSDQPVIEPIPRPQPEVKPSEDYSKVGAMMEPGKPYGLRRGTRWTGLDNNGTEYVVWIRPDGEVSPAVCSGCVKVRYRLNKERGPIGFHVWLSPVEIMQ